MLNEIIDAARAVLTPLADALSDPDAFAGLLERAGWDVGDLDDDALAVLGAGFGVEGDLAVVMSYDGSTNVDDLLDVVDAAAGVVTAIEEIIDGDRTFDVTQLPFPFDDPDRLPALGRSVLDVVVSSYVSDAWPIVNSLLLIAGVRPQVEPGPIHWSRLPDLFDAPGQTLADAYGWGSSLDLRQLDAAFVGLAALAPLPLERRPVRDALAQDHWPSGVPDGLHEYVISFARISEPIDGEFGLVVVPVPDGGGGPPAGILIAPIAAGAASHTEALSPAWDLRLSAEADLTGVIGLALLPTPPSQPDALPGLQVVPTTGAGDFGVEFALTGRPPEPGAWGFGGDNGPRLDLHGVELAFAIDGPANALEPSARLAIRAPDGGPGLTVSLADPEADGFMSWIISDAAIEASLEIEVSPSGFRLVGGLGFDISIPIDKQFGPLYLAKADLGLEVEIGETAALRTQATVTGNVRIGPLVMVVDGIGVALVVEAAPDGDGLFGRTDLRFEFVPPTAFGAALDSEIVTGGGYVEITPPRYSGILDLQVLSVGITVIGVVDAAGADAPPGAPGFSLYLSVMTEFTPIPLAFGFTLNGVGGIVAFNRTMNTDALVDGLFAGDLDHILYPDDPIADAPQILASIDAFFPVQQGATTFGPIVKIGWGIPVTLVTIDLGVIISFPDVAIALIGKVHVALPDEEFPLLELNAQVLGLVDFAGPTIMILASINDSQVLGIQLTGEFAVYLDMGPSPYFMFSVGGTHPDWVPPAGLPSALHDLERLGASIVLSPTVFIRVGGYFALTSNTVQFGGGLHFEASTKFLRTTYYAIGVFEVNVLIVFNPFRIKAGLRAGCEVRTDKRVLFGVMFTAEFEGPDPWYASGGAEFKFFGIKVTFPVEIGDKSRPGISPPVAVEDELAAALRHPDAWGTVPATDDGSTSDVISWVTFDGDAVAPTRPQDAIELRQTVVPLNTVIEKFGTGEPAGANLFEIGTVELAGEPTEADVVTDVFAPSLFFKMKQAEKLSSPSFQHYDAGVSFGAGASVSESDEATVSITHEQRIVGDVASAPRPQRVPLPVDRLVAPAAAELLRTDAILVAGPILEVVRR